MVDILYTGTKVVWNNNKVYNAELSYTETGSLVPEGIYSARMARRNGLTRFSGGNALQLDSLQSLAFNHQGFKLEFSPMTRTSVPQTHFFLHSKPVSMLKGVYVEPRFFQDLNLFLLSNKRQAISLKIAYAPWVKYATPWVKTGIDEIGEKEVAGKKFNKRIVEDYFKASKFWGQDDSGGANAWCASFVSWVMKQHGYTPPKSAYRAKEWKNLFILGKNSEGTSYYMLGGNQADAVNVKEYPKSVWDTFVVPSDYSTHLGALPIYTGESSLAGKEH